MIPLEISIANMQELEQKGEATFMHFGEDATYMAYLKQEGRPLYVKELNRYVVIGQLDEATR